MQHAPLLRLRSCFAPLVLLFVLSADDGVAGPDQEVPTYTIHGRVVDDRGRAVAGARVSWDLGALLEGRHPDRVARSDKHGTFTLVVRDRWGKYVRACELYAAAEGLALSRSVERLAYEVPFDAPWHAQRPNEFTWAPAFVSMDGEVRDVLIRMRRLGSIRLNVVDERGMPVAGVACAWSGLEKPGRKPLRTDDRGVVLFTDLPAGLRSITLLRPGSESPCPSIRATTLVHAGRTTTHRVVLPDTLSITGRVLGPAGKPDFRCLVLVQGEDWWDRAFALTDRQGRFEARGLIAGRRYRVLAHRPIRGYATPVHVRAGGDVVLRLRRPGILRGRFEWTEGASPVPLDVRPSPVDRAATDHALPESLRFGGDPMIGPSFRVGGVPPGRYDLSAWDSHKTERRVVERPGDSVEVEVPPDGESEEAVLTFIPTVALRGTVRWEDGTPARGTAIVCVSQWSDSRVDNDGRFRLGGLLPGDVRLLVGGTNRETGWIEHWATTTVKRGPTKETVVVLRRGGGLRLAALDELGDGVKQAHVSLRNEKGALVPPAPGLDRAEVRRWTAEQRNIFHWRAASTTDLNGVAFRGSLPPGMLVVEIVADGYEPTVLAVEIGIGEVTRRIVTLRKQ